MNLPWEPVKIIRANGKAFQLQCADVTGNKKFWLEYRAAVRTEREINSLNLSPAEKPLLTNYVSISRQVYRNGIRSYAYRLYPDGPGHKPPPLPPYMLQSARGLLDYQPEAVTRICAAIIRHGAAIDGSDTGIGKSYHAVSAALNLGLRPLIITRKSAITAWRGVCDHFNVQPVDIINWETAKAGAYPCARRQIGTVSGKARYVWDKRIPLVVFDEAHMASNYGSLNNAFWRGAGEAGISTLSMSATFADRTERMRTLVVDILHAMTIEQWQGWLRDHAVFEDQYNSITSLSDQEDLIRIHRLLYPQYGARITTDHPQVKKHFPEEIRRIQLIDLGAKNTREQNTRYTKLVEQVSKLKEQGKNVEAVTVELRYRQATELLKAETLAGMASNYIEQGHSVTLFVNFIETLKYLAKRLKTKSLIFGDQDRYGIIRDDVIRNFQADRSRIIISMVQAGGQSISLHYLRGRYPRIALIPPTYTAIDLLQIRGRIYRAKAKTRATSILVYAAGTIETKVALTVNEKLNNIKALMDGDLMESDLFGKIDATERIKQFSQLIEE